MNTGTKIVKTAIRTSALALAFAVLASIGGTATAGAVLAVEQYAQVQIRQNRSVIFKRAVPRRNRFAQNRAGNRRGVISPSAALRAAMSTSPGSQGLGVRFINRTKSYIVRLRTGGRVHRVIVDGRTGRVRY